MIKTIIVYINVAIIFYLSFKRHRIINDIYNKYHIKPRFNLSMFGYKKNNFNDRVEYKRYKRINYLIKILWAITIVIMAYG